MLIRLNGRYSNVYPFLLLYYCILNFWKWVFCNKYTYFVQICLLCCCCCFSEIVDEWPYCRSVPLYSCHETIALRTVSPSTSSLHCNYCTRLWRRFHGTGLYWKWNSQSPELTFQSQWQDLNIKTDGAYELGISGYVAAVLDERNDGRFAWIIIYL